MIKQLRKIFIPYRLKQQINEQNKTNNNKTYVLENIFTNIQFTYKKDNQKLQYHENQVKWS